MREKAMFPIAIFSVIFALYVDCGAFDSKNTHPLITRQAVGKAEFSKSFLKDVLQFSGDSDKEDVFGKEFEKETTYLRCEQHGDNEESCEERTVVKKQSLRGWLEEGSYREDKPICRATNHFHNPLESWDKSCLNDEYCDGLLAKITAGKWCTLTGWKSSDRKSDVVWATGLEDTDGTPASFPTPEMNRKPRSGRQREIIITMLLYRRRKTQRAGYGRGIRSTRQRTASFAGYGSSGPCQK